MKCLINLELSDNVNIIPVLIPTEYPLRIFLDSSRNSDYCSFVNIRVKIGHMRNNDEQLFVCPMDIDNTRDDKKIHKIVLKYRQLTFPATKLCCLISKIGLVDKFFFR